MTKRVVAGLLILFFALSFALFSEWAIGDAVQTLEKSLQIENTETFMQEYAARKTLLQVLLNDSVVSELDVAIKKMSSFDEAERKEGKEETEGILLRVRAENLFSLVKLF